VQRFRSLADHLQVWPAHGAGSACGKGLGAIPSSTVGYEKLFNPALQFDNEEEFVRYILADQPEAPKYFAVMKRVNKEGPKVLGAYSEPPRLPASALDGALDAGAVVDLSAPASFSAGFARGTLNIPAGMLAGWAGWLLNYDEPVYLIAEGDQVAEAVRVLNKIGVDEVAGVFSADELRQSGRMDHSYPNIDPEALADRIASGDVNVIDVRAQSEWDAGHIPQADHRFLGKLPDNLAGIDRSKPVVTQCQSGSRSAIAASLLVDAGYDVINLAGGYGAWSRAGLPAETGAAACGTVPCATA